MNRNESLIDETLHSLDGIRRAEPGPGLYDKVAAKAANPEGKVVAMPNGRLLRAVAAIALLVIINMAAVLFYRQTTNKVSSTPQAIAADYLSYLEPVNLK